MKNKMLYKPLILLVVTLGAFQGFSQTLETYLMLASKNNADIKVAYSKFEAALQKAPQVSSLPDPGLSVSAFGRMIETRIGTQEARFSLMQMFPWFGSLAAKEDAANAMAEATFQNYVDTKNEVLFNVKKMYGELYELQKMIQLEEENLKILETYKELGLSKFKNAKGTLVDVVRIDIKKNESIMNIQILKDRQKSMQSGFNAILNRGFNESVAFPDALPNTILDARAQTDSLFVNNPKLVMLDNETKAYEAQKIAAIKDGYPKIGIGLDYSIISKRDVADLAMNGQDAIMPMLTVTLPIFRKKYNAAKKEADYQIQATEAKKEAVKNNLMASYSMAQYEVTKAQNLITLFEAQIKSTQQAVSLLTTSYSNSGSDFVEILRMNQEVLMYEKAKATETKNQFIAQAKLEFLLAKPE